MMKTYRDNITRSANLLPFNQLRHHYSTFVMHRDFVMWSWFAGNPHIFWVHYSTWPLPECTIAIACLCYYGLYHGYFGAHLLTWYPYEISIYFGRCWCHRHFTIEGACLDEFYQNFPLVPMGKFGNFHPNKYFHRYIRSSLMTIILKILTSNFVWRDVSKYLVCIR